MTLRVFEAFAGIGTQRMALRNLGIDHEVVAISEIDKFAIQSYEAIHGEVKNLGDITKLDDDAIPDHDLFTYSFPCQDISVAGQGKGLAEGSGTRSSLLWECERVIEAKRPKYLLLENVKNLVGKKNKPYFDKWLEVLENYGYTNYWQVLNAKDFGIPQNRERVFVVSILGEHEPYVFPNKEELTLRLKDVLEDEVDEKYYLNNEKAEQLIATITEKNNITNPTVVDATVNEPKTKEIMNTITARYDAGIQNYKSIGGAVIEPERILGIFDQENSKHQAGSVYNKDKIAPTLDTMQGGWRQPSIIDEPKIAASRGRNPENPSDRTKGAPTEQRLEVNDEGTSNTITTVQKDNYVVEPLGTLASGASEQFGAGYMHGLSKTLKANKHDISVLEGVDVHPFSKKLEFQGYKQKEISPCLLATDYKAPKTVLEGIPIKNATNKGYLIAKEGDGVDLAYPTSNTRRGRVQEDISQTLTTDDSKGVVEVVRKLAKKSRPNDDIEISVSENGDIRPHRMDVKKSGIQELNINHENNPSHTVTTNHMPKVYGPNTEYRIRKLTPLECWRLMGCSDEDFRKAESVCSNSQLYKQAGNAIVVDVLEMILGQLLLGEDGLLEYREFKSMMR